MRILRTLVLAAFTTAIALPLAALLLPSRSAVAVDVADLKQQLESGLKARRPVEFRFIGRVVALTERGDLPLELVKSTFQWARKKAGSKQYPFPYFERALRIRAAELGIQI